MPEEQENPIERRETGGGIGRRSDIARRGMNAANYIRELSNRKPNIRRHAQDAGSPLPIPYDEPIDGNYEATEYKLVGVLGIARGKDSVFRDPEDVAVDAQGNVYVADSGNSRVQKFTSDGAFIGSFATEGRGVYWEEINPNILDYPTALTIDPNGNVYVCDHVYGTPIKKFDLNGVVIEMTGLSREATSSFWQTSGVAVDQTGNVYVVDSRAHKVHKFTSNGALIDSWGTPGQGREQFQEPHGIGVDLRGTVYVADQGNDRVQKFTSDGKYLGFFGASGNKEGELSHPCGLTLDAQGNVYVADNGNHRIQKFTPDGKHLGCFGTYGNGEGEFRSPKGVVIGLQGNVYVTDDKNDSVQIFSTNGGFIGSIGSLATKEGEFRRPKSLGVDQRDNVYVADVGNHRVQKFASDGSFVMSFGVEGTGIGEFGDEITLAVDLEDNVYVADTCHHRIQKFTSDGTYIGFFGSQGEKEGQFNSPTCLAVDGLGNVYVADSRNKRAQKFSPNGRFLCSFAMNRPSELEFNGLIAGVWVDAHGIVYLTGGELTQRFTPHGEYIDDFENLPWASDIALDGAGNLYVNHFQGDGQRWVEKHAPDGESILQPAPKPGERYRRVCVIGEKEPLREGLEGYKSPEGITVDRQGNVYISDSGYQRILKYSPLV